MSAYALKPFNHLLDNSGDVTAGHIQMTTDRLREPAQQVCNQLMSWCGIKQIKE